jgi:predicted alpha/beta-fold hydrolase
VLTEHRHVDELTHHPRLNVDDMKDVKYIHEFDRYVFLPGTLQYTDISRAVQCPLWGYPTEGAYHRDASSVDSLLAIRIPFLAINAEDDPVSTLYQYMHSL